MRSIFAALILVTCALAHADVENVEDARRLYLAGRQAYEAGRLALAAQSFEAAYRLQPRPALLWNLGQTYRRRFLEEERVELLIQAVDAYRHYLVESPGGENRDEATRLLTELTPLLVRLAPERIGNAPPPPAPSPPKTELMIVADAEQASVSLDGNTATPAPLLAEVDAGEHHARVDGLGYFPVELKVKAVAGRLVTSEARLLPRPALVDVHGPAGARLIVDQQASGRLPRPSVELAPGAHAVTVLLRGREPWVAPLMLQRGAHAELTARLRPTRQRRAVPWMAGLGGAAALTSIALGAVWGRAQADAQGLGAILEKGGQLTLDQNTTYESDKSRRDQYRVATIVTLSLTGALAIGAGALYWFDEPSLPDTHR
jgi:hypothetical protein